MQPSADNRTGYVVDLAGNIYELLRPPGSSVPVQSATIFLFLSLSFSLARFRFHFLALSLSLSARFCLSAGGPWSPRVRMCAGREVTRFAGNQHFRLRDRTGIHSRHGACIRAVISEYATYSRSRLPGYLLTAVVELLPARISVAHRIRFH